VTAAGTEIIDFGPKPGHGVAPVSDFGPYVRAHQEGFEPRLKSKSWLSASSSAFCSEAIEDDSGFGQLAGFS